MKMLEQTKAMFSGMHKDFTATMAVVVFSFLPVVAALYIFCFFIWR